MTFTAQHPAAASGRHAGHVVARNHTTRGNLTGIVRVSRTCLTRLSWTPCRERVR